MLGSKNKEKRDYVDKERLSNAIKLLKEKNLLGRLQFSLTLLYTYGIQ